MTIEPGDRLWLPVVADLGAFPGESLVSFDTLDGPVSGFIRTSEIHDEGGQSFIEAFVVDVDNLRIVVNLHGSFFTTTGRAHISKETSYRRAA